MTEQRAHVGVTALSRSTEVNRRFIELGRVLALGAKRSSRRRTPQVATSPDRRMQWQIRPTGLSDRHLLTWN